MAGCSRAGPPHLLAASPPPQPSLLLPPPPPPSPGDCLLEWDGGSGGDEPPPVPLLKDLYASERRRAKVLNFSIAYGKTAHGLSKDWKVTLEEAKETVARWYADRPEVRRWQEARHAEAVQDGYVSTLLGRRRNLPDARSKNKAVKAHALRAAINTPIQGSAADVATAAMIRIHADPRLAAMGWRLLLQVRRRGRGWWWMVGWRNTSSSSS